MTFPSTIVMPALLDANDLTWHPPSDNMRFWTCIDTHGTRWLVKFRGGFCAARERAFSIIAQALNISCQSSTFLKMPSQLNLWPSASQKIESTDVCQLAIWLLAEHSHRSLCDNCPLQELNEQFQKRPYDVDLLRTSRVTNLLDWARGEMLGMLCEMHEPPGRLFTADHAFVQIDNELMFARNAGADLRDSPWVIKHDKQINRAGLVEAIRLCEQVLLLPNSVFREANRTPAGYKPRMVWSVRKKIDGIRPRAQDFLKWATSIQNFW